MVIFPPTLKIQLSAQLAEWSFEITTSAQKQMSGAVVPGRLGEIGLDLRPH
ncbi:MAG: hypothetical protein AB8B85_17640 [Paracoccaceae bacterium]